jgi:asparagine synthetase B (glutamine-hydrolysing)
LFEQSRFFLDRSSASELAPDGKWREIDASFADSTKAGVGWESGANRFSVEVAQTTREGEGLVTVSSRAGSMSVALEVRVPFLDFELVQFATSIPGKLKLKGFTTKAIMREVLRGHLPANIVWRKKQGYSFPIKNWMRGELADFTHDEIFSSQTLREYFDPEGLRRLWDEHQAKRHNHSHLLWTLLNVGLWARMFEVS